MTQQINDDRGLISIARIARTQGRVGEVAAELLTDFPERFVDLHDVIVRLPSGTDRPSKLTNSWPHKGRIVLKFEGIDSISDAEKLIGGTVLISPEELVELPEDSFFDFDLEGCVVVDRSDHRIGEVREVVRTGGAALLSVIDDEGSEKLIPFIESICVEVDIPGKKIVIEPPDGLLDL